MDKVLYKLKQIPMEKIVSREVKYVFYPFAAAAERNFSLDDYEVTYEGYLDTSGGKDINSYLEDLYYKFNQELPNDFDGRCLSVSDVIEFDGVDYYVDCVGFVKL